VPRTPRRGIARNAVANHEDKIFASVTVGTHAFRLPPNVWGEAQGRHPWQQAQAENALHRPRSSWEAASAMRTIFSFAAPSSQSCVARP
jgi:hypothetical protein